MAVAVLTRVAFKIILENLCRCTVAAVRPKPSRLLHCEVAHQVEFTLPMLSDVNQRLWTKGDRTSARGDGFKGYFYTEPDETAGSSLHALC